MTIPTASSRSSSGSSIPPIPRCTTRTTFAVCCAQGSARGLSPDPSTRGSPSSTRWAQTSAAPPDWRPRSIGHMAIDVTVLRVFTDQDGSFGNPLGVVDASQAEPSQRQRIATELGYSETVFIDVPEPGASTAHARIYTPVTELPFAGHPTVGAS